MTDYHYACPLDQRFLNFVGIDPEALKVEVAKGLGDGALLAWIESNASKKREEFEIAQWSTQRETSAPSDNESREFANELVAKAGGSDREDLASWFEILDFDDHVTYGGQP